MATSKGNRLLPLDLTKWFDTNYHQLVPELGQKTVFHADGLKLDGEIAEATALGISTVPVLLGPLTLLLRSAATEPDFEVLRLLDALVDTYAEILSQLKHQGVVWVRLDEPALVEDRNAAELIALSRAYGRLAESRDRPSIEISTYFGHVGSAMPVLADLPVEGVGLDLCRGRENLELLRSAGGLGAKVLFAGVVDGRNVWRNDLDASLGLLDAPRRPRRRGGRLHLVLAPARPALPWPRDGARRRGPTLAGLRQGEARRARHPCTGSHPWAGNRWPRSWRPTGRSLRPGAVRPAS